jgi:hypothetical protein
MVVDQQQQGEFRVTTRFPFPLSLPCCMAGSSGLKRSREWPMLSLLTGLP